MRTLTAILACVGLLFAALSGVRGTDPARTVPPPSSGKDAGRVLVLENERTITGDIERVGDQYRIKRLLGETFLPAAQVLKLCSSLEEAYQFLQRRANLNDPDERLRLAEWCRQHGLRRQAVDEARGALALKPEDERLRRLVRYLEEVLARKDAPTPTPVAREEVHPRVEVSADSLNLFTSRVQPILLNACASCHVAGRGGAFQLTRVYGSGVGNRRSVEKNLASVLAQINLNDPRASRLLSKAVSVHAPGMNNAPLRGRQSAAYRSIEEWLLLTLENNPQLREQASAASVSWPAAAVRPDSVRPDSAWGQDREARSVAPAPRPAPAPAALGTPMPPSAAAVNPVPPTPAPRAERERAATPDPVDPEDFNREFHPGRGKLPIAPAPGK